MNGKALEQRTALAVSAWPVPLFPLGFSASNPVTGAESLACWGSLVPSLGGGASPGWVDSLLWSACLGWRPPPLGCTVAEIFVGYTQPCLRMVSWWLKISL